MSPGGRSLVKIHQSCRVGPSEAQGPYFCSQKIPMLSLCLDKDAHMVASEQKGIPHRPQEVSRLAGQSGLSVSSTEWWQQR